MAKSDDDIVSETIAPINILLMEKLNVLESHKQVAIRAYRLAESSEESKYRKLVEGLMKEISEANERYGGKIFVSVISSLITEIEGGDNGKAEG